MKEASDVVGGDLEQQRRKYFIRGLHPEQLLHSGYSVSDVSPCKISRDRALPMYSFGPSQMHATAQLTCRLNRCLRRPFSAYTRQEFTYINYKLCVCERFQHRAIILHFRSFTDSLCTYRCARRRWFVCRGEL